MNTPLILVPKQELADSQLKHIENRLRLPDHANDSGPPHVWHIYSDGLYAVICPNMNNEIIGLIESSGIPPTPGWWVDSKHRKKGFGNELIDALVLHIKKQGVTKIGYIDIQGEYAEASNKLKQRLLQQFTSQNTK